MPQYHDAMLDHSSVGVRTVFWPDQIAPTKSSSSAFERTRSTTRSILAALKRHCDSYTVSPPAAPTSSFSCSSSHLKGGWATLQHPPSQPSSARQHALARSRSYTEARPAHITWPSWSRTPSPICYESVPTSTAKPSPSTTPSPPAPSLPPLPRPSKVKVSPPNPKPTTPNTGGRGGSGGESRNGTPRAAKRSSGCWRGSSPPSPSPPATPVVTRCLPQLERPSRRPVRGGSFTAPASPTEAPRGWPSPSPRRAAPADEVGGSSTGVGNEQWVLCTLSRPRTGRNRRVQKMNQMSMEKNTAQYQQWLQDTPKPSKGGALLSRAYSFKEKLIGMKSPMRSTGKIVKVEPSHSSESVESKVEHVWRALDFYRDVVEKSMIDMLPGSATVVLEMVLALNLALKPCFSNQNSSAVASVIARVHHSIAELVRWSDQFLLRGDEAQNTQTVQQVVQAVRDAVQALVDLAADKENLNISDSSIMDITPSAVDNNNSINSEKSTSYYRNSDTVSNHRNSLPEITAESPVEKNSRSFLSPRDSSTKLSHSLSSDSILNSTVETPPPKPPLPTGRNDIAPPLPPKKKNQCKRSSPENGVGTPMYQSSPLGHSSPVNRSPRESSSDWPPQGSGPYTGSLDRGSHTAQSSDQVSPASSMDSMNQSHDDSVICHTSINSCGSLNDRLDLDFERSIQKNFKLGLENRLGHRLTDFDTSSMCFSDSGFPSLSSVNSLSSNTGFSSFNQPFLSHMSKSTSESQAMMESRTETYFSSSSQVSSKVSCSTKRVVSYQHFTTTRSSTSSSVSSASSSSSGCEGEKVENNTMSIQVPPALPVKQRIQQGRRSAEMRTASTYDNVINDFPDSDTVDSHDSRYKKDDPSPKLPPKIGNLQLGGSSSSSTSSVNSGYMSSTTSMLSNSSNASSQGSSSVVQLRRHTTVFQSQYGSSAVNDDNPPPLPVKKKHVMDYMKLFGEVNEPSESDLLRNSVHQIHLHEDWHAHQTEHELIHAHAFSMMQGTMEHISSIQPPPALPPKRKQRSITTTSRQSLPPAMRVVPITAEVEEQKTYVPSDNSRRHGEERDEPEEVIVQDQCLHIEKKTPEKEEEEEEEEEESLLDYLEVQVYLILKKEGDEGPDIRGGPVDALVVHASKANQNDFLYQEAFLTTYRTFVSPSELVTKLLYRYDKFTRSPDVERQKAARNAFSLLVRVVDELTITDLNIEILETLTNFEYNLLCCGELLLARALRKKIVEKLEARKRYYAPNESLTIASREVTTRQSTLLDFKSHEIAEQMTLLDAELFHNMEIPEVLLWAREQNEERSPNLTTFTEHFNKMSYWARSRILEQDDAKDREKYVMKFIKIMKHLRKINNFNSYLALLSALDSAPIRRLEWQRNVTEGLKEYCALIDSSCSFRAYRQALSDSTPPCIPYIGLILQDLTFVDIGNNELMPDGNVNFSKRWQQFNILDNMKRFKKCHYPFKKNEKVIAFFNNFDDYHNEEALWHISESIKPRGGKKK